MAVFVLDRRQRPLMPCSEKRARQLLARQRAVVHRLTPFTIRLKDRVVEASVLQPVVLKVDPGSRTTGLALAREEETPAGAVHHALHLAHLAHRGTAVHTSLVQRAAYRRRRRRANLRYRAPHWANRRRREGWLSPSLVSRVGNVLTWAKRYLRFVPLCRLEIEQVCFDTQLLQHPEIAGMEYQHGTRATWKAVSIAVSATNGLQRDLSFHWQYPTRACGCGNMAV
jgi:hypothetical protein